MKLSRSGLAVGSAMAASVMVLGACSSNADNNSDSAAASAVSDIQCEGKQDLKASGSTAQANAMTIFSTSFAKTCPGFELAYGGGGSGQGVSDFNQGLTDFGGSDSPIEDEDAAAAAQRCSSEAWNLPLVFGPIAVAYNIDGVDNLALSGPTLAKIFSGEITKWNDPAIAAENAGVDLPDEQISVLYRADQSGTTDNFQKYLTAAGGYTKGTGKTFNGGVGEGKQGNPGVGSAVAPTPGSIAYVEWAFAQSNNLSMAKIITDQDPEGVALTAESGGKTIESATLANGPDSHNMVIDTSSFYKPTQAGAYPIVLATYEIVCSKYSDTPTAQGVKTFLNVASAPQNQGADLQAAGYIPLPQDFQTKLQSSIDAIQ
ncbi:phosphate ABC transporter substrate-binding protein PstS [Gordonia rhizosphera]|uniref:Phosphate-binding protein n=1 Tax=Gordonia rhizosphera NBRC 16068 TaxID=1108045 RepID=K6X241_9ACTN|nr:phosphate ABC transporter substrate-binding protein PstS [Gordonia rhizosphera]GAB92839.1 phosphate ABC transporter substrate-binding protein [Gordonia rhizosphera NBRC 16068]